MRRYRFGLATVLKVRRIERDRARGEMAEAERAARHAADTLVDRHDAYLRAAGGDAAPVPLSTFLANRSSAELAAASVVMARNWRARSEAEVLARRAALASAAASVAALEELEQRGRAAHRKAAMRQEAKAIDDLVNRPRELDEA
jgi:flagellar export protein FliJ